MLRYRFFTGFIFLIIFTIGCAKKQHKIFQPQDSTWTIYTENLTRSKFQMKIKLSFKKDGFAYEDKTVLKFPYRLHHNGTILELNHQLYDIVEYQSDTVYLQNRSSKIISKMVKQ